MTITSLRSLAIAGLLITAGDVLAQNVAINGNGAAPDASAILDLDVSSAVFATKKGLLIPRIALTAANVAAPVTAPATSLLIYNTATAGAAPNNVTPGFYYWDGANWVRMASGSQGWTILGNAGTTPTTNFIGTTDANDWVIKTGGSAATNERARVLAGGQVVVNNTSQGLNTNDVFSVYGTGTTNGSTANTSALGLRAISGYTSTGFGLFGNATGTTTTSFGVYGLANGATGSASAIRGESASNATTAIIGIGNTSGGAVAPATSAKGVQGQVNGTLTGTGVGMGVFGITSNVTMLTGDARGVYGQTASDNGAGTFGWATSALVTGNTAGALGFASSSTGFGVDGANLTATGTGVLGEGNNLFGTYLIGGGGGAFTGTTNGSFSYAVSAANGTGVIGAGNASAVLNTLATGGGGAFTGTNNGAYGSATTAASGTGVIGVGNGLLPNALGTGGGGAFNGSTTGAFGSAATVASGTGLIGAGNGLAANVLATGSGGAFAGTNTGAYGLATTVASGTGVIGVGNNAGVNTLATGSGGAFTGINVGSYGRATTGASATGVVGAGNNVAPTVLATGGGGAFAGTNTGAYGLATTVASGTGLIGVGNNVTPALTMTAGSGVAGTGVSFGVYGAATSILDGAAGAPVRAGGYFESGLPVGGAPHSYAYVGTYEGAGVPRKIVGNGTVNTTVKNTHDEFVLLSAPEAPENLFQDYGTGTLENGRAHIALDPTFAKNIQVDQNHPLRVFVQLRGDCNGVFVSNESGSGFDVVELQSGTSNASFYWTVTGNRADQVLADGTVVPFAQERFARTNGPQIRSAVAGNTVTPGMVEAQSVEGANNAVHAAERATVKNVRPEPIDPAAAADQDKGAPRPQ